MGEVGGGGGLARPGEGGVALGGGGGLACGVVGEGLSGAGRRRGGGVGGAYGAEEFNSPMPVSRITPLPGSSTRNSSVPPAASTNRRRVER